MPVLTPLPFFFHSFFSSFYPSFCPFILPSLPRSDNLTISKMITILVHLHGQFLNEITSIKKKLKTVSIHSVHDIYRFPLVSKLHNRIAGNKHSGHYSTSSPARWDSSPGQAVSRYASLVILSQVSWTWGGTVCQLSHSFLPSFFPSFFSFFPSFFPFILPSFPHSYHLTISKIITILVHLHGQFLNEIISIKQKL